MRQLKLERKTEYATGMAMALLLFSGPTPALAEDTSAFYALAGTDVREELTDTQLAQVQGGQIGTFTVQGQREFTLPSNGDIGDINVTCTPILCRDHSARRCDGHKYDQCCKQHGQHFQQLRDQSDQYLEYDISRQMNPPS